MIIGVPTEIKAEENRVALTPAGVAAFCGHGHVAMVQRGAGLGSNITDQAYRAAGARIVSSAAIIWQRADLILKVKEPQPSEIRFLHPGMILFTYLHLAASKPLARELLKRRVAALGYETVQLKDGSLPLLAPMSEVAGRLAIQAGAWCLQARGGGRGVLLSGASGVRPGKVMILGAGIAGANACQVAVGVGAEVTVLDVDASRLLYMHDILGGHITTLMSNRALIEEELLHSDLVIGAVLVPGARAPRLITAAMVAKMKRGRRDRRSLDRPGRRRRDFACDHSRQADLHPRGRGPLLRDQYARRGAAYLHLRLDQRDALLRAGNRRSRRARSGRAESGDPPRPQHLRRPSRASRRRRRPQAPAPLAVGLANRSSQPRDRMLRAPMVCYSNLPAGQHCQARLPLESSSSAMFDSSTLRRAEQCTSRRTRNERRGKTRA